ncbi:MAG: hypothetical protein KGL95_10440, partial [Patescibacteria group bacterium]|nr:hypothetical protein [Patescibacteria group bacterium]
DINSGDDAICLKSGGGKDCFSPIGEGIEELKKNGYVKVTVCKNDKNSKHGAKTCKVEIGWLTELGKKTAEVMLRDVLEERFQQLRDKINLMNPRISIFLKFLLLKWALWCVESPRTSPLSLPIYLDGHVSTDNFSWVFSIPSYRSSNTEFLPSTVKNEVENLKSMLLNLSLAGEKSSHNTNGWHSSTLISVKAVALRIIDEYWGTELPWPINLLIESVYKSYGEKKLAFSLDYSKLDAKDVVEHLHNASMREIANFLFLLHSSFRTFDHETETYPLNWKILREILSTYSSDEHYHESVATNMLGGKHLEQLFEFRHDAIISKVRKCLMEWIETGK